VGIATTAAVAATTMLIDAPALGRHASSMSFTRVIAYGIEFDNLTLWRFDRISSSERFLETKKTPWVVAVANSWGRTKTRIGVYVAK
jgi:hypothetical protein